MPKRAVRRIYRLTPGIVLLLEQYLVGILAKGRAFL